MDTNRADDLLAAARDFAVEGLTAHALRRYRMLDTYLSAGGAPPEAWREGPDAPADSIEYEIGDADPTPDDAAWCGAGDPEDYTCTWHPGHRGAHVAGDGVSVVAVWADR